MKIKFIIILSIFSILFVGCGEDETPKVVKKKEVVKKIVKKKIPSVDSFFKLHDNFTFVYRTTKKKNDEILSKTYYKYNVSQLEEQCLTINRYRYYSDDELKELLQEERVTIDLRTNLKLEGTDKLCTDSRRITINGENFFYLGKNVKMKIALPSGKVISAPCTYEGSREKYLFGEMSTLITMKCSYKEGSVEYGATTTLAKNIGFLEFNGFKKIDENTTFTQETVLLDLNKLNLKKKEVIKEKKKVIKYDDYNEDEEDNEDDDDEDEDDDYDLVRDI